MPPQNGSVEAEPSIPAPVRPGTVPIELPESLPNKMCLEDFHFLKVINVDFSGLGREGEGEGRLCLI